MNTQTYLTQWNLHNDKYTMKAQVPGDITMDFYRAGLIQNPYVEENYKDASFIGREDFVYETRFDVSEESFANASQTLVFESVDLFSEIYLNGEKIGETKNAFLKYRFDVSALLKKQGNVLSVHMHSTLLASEKIDVTGYAATFNVPRTPTGAWPTSFLASIIPTRASQAFSNATWACLWSRIWRKSK